MLTPEDYKNQQLTVICPETQLPLPTGVQINAVVFATAVFINVRVQCPHCGGEHRWSKEDAFLVEIEGSAPTAGGFGPRSMPGSPPKPTRIHPAAPSLD